MTPRVTVVVPTYRRAALLKRCLAALADQTLRSTDYEIVIVHDGPGDEAYRSVAGSHPPGFPRGRFLELPAQRGPAAARNRGWREARGRCR